MIRSHYRLLSTNLPLSLPLFRPIPFFPSSSFSRVTITRPIQANLGTNFQTWLAQSIEPTTNMIIPPSESGPIELPSPISDVFATTDDPSSLQVATSVLLTGAIAIFLFRSLRRRAKRAKELRFRSTGATKTLKDEALDSLKAIKLTSVEKDSPPSPVQALLGGLAAGVIALILYKFTTTIEASLNRQTIADNFSVRQITITVRTIINGICYLATFVFGINAVGLILYSGQLALSSFMDGSMEEAFLGDDGSRSSTNISTKSTEANQDSISSDKDQSSESSDSGS
ncbi:hypothetical protein C5167_039544 [Papaver somniferum]|uniref:DUF3082 domain-containing protein n=1 Tax=Papaver somniferum TaxID=3469 RepID=A0A4Y7IGN2_PAPSO|nr:uncharacterized protein LOC113307845 [Papaver somniferum]RZC46595.1 hypothetical protein C5167_039544 [Papaver somniferum]